MDSNAGNARQVHNLAQLKRYLKKGGLLRVIQHTDYPCLSGLVLQAGKVCHAHAYFCVLGQPLHTVSLHNQGRGLRLAFGLATEYEIAGSHGYRLFERYGYKQPGRFAFEIVDLKN